MSALLTIPFDLIAIVNYWRIEKNLSPMYHAGYLRNEAELHLQKILKGQIYYGLDGWEERKRRATSLFRKYDEILMKIPLNMYIPEEVLKDKDVTKVLSYPYYNYCGAAALECGNYYFLFLLVGEMT